MANSAIFEPLVPFGQGFVLYISVIVALGPQNLFVLRQGLLRRHVFATAFISTAADVLVTTLAVGGAGALISRSETFMTALTITGVAFLLGYGVRSLRSARQSSGPYYHEQRQAPATGLAAVLAAALAFAFLNPGAYVDTFLVLGPAGWQLPSDQRAFFILGAVSATALWFFGLAYGARFFVGLLKRRNASSAIDRAGGWLMIGMACVLANRHLL